MSRYENDRYDILNLIHFHSREALRAFDTYKEHCDVNLVRLRKEEPKDKGATFGVTERIEMTEKFIEKINIGKEEIDIIIAVCTFCDIMSTDGVRTRMQVYRLVTENRWLRSELTDLQKRLMKLEENVKNADAEKQHYQYVYKMRNSQRTDAGISYLGAGDDDDDTDPEEEVPAKIKPVHNLCLDYLREKRYEVALPLVERSLAENKGKLGENNNEVATLYSIMGKIHKEQGNWIEAQDYYDRSLKIREKVLGKDHNGTGITLTNLAQIMFKRNNVKEAEKLATQALKIREKTLGKTHVDVALIHAHLGTYYITLEKWNDCVNHYKIAMGIYEQMFDSTDNLIIKGYVHMAMAYVKLKQNDKSAELLGMICKSFQDKNSLDNHINIFQMAQNGAGGKVKNFTPEMLMKEFGSYDNVIDSEILDIMIDYFINIKKNDVAEILKQWGEISNKAPTTAVRQSMIKKRSKRHSTHSNPKNSSVSQSSKKDNNLIGFFKKNKKEK